MNLFFRPDKVMVMCGHKMRAQVGLSFAPRPPPPIFFFPQVNKVQSRCGNRGKSSSPKRSSRRRSRAAQSFTYTDKLNSWSRWWEGEHKIEKAFPFSKRCTSVFPPKKQKREGKVLLRRFITVTLKFRVWELNLGGLYSHLLGKTV